MIKIILDGKEMKTRETVYPYIKKQLSNIEYYGNNLDALWDVLMSYSEDIIINLKNKVDLIENLGDYGYLIIELFEEAKNENENIVFEIMDLDTEQILTNDYFIIEDIDYINSSWPGGKTTQMMIYPSDSSYINRDFDFRISCANVELDESEFTKLEGINRFITPLDKKLKLTHDNLNFVDLDPFEVYEFSGDIPTISYGKARDFNLMLSNNSKGLLKSLNIKNDIRLDLFDDKIFDFGSNNFTIILSPYENLDILVDDKRIELKKMNLFVIRKTTFNQYIDIVLSVKKNTDILLSQVSLK